MLFPYIDELSNVQSKTDQLKSICYMLGEAVFYNKEISNCYYQIIILLQDILEQNSAELCQIIRCLQQGEFE